ncbi:MAG TPA: galactose oxidase-like domain-containing protein [Gemmatimonadales bacterium]|nr:galactose oxidase-like domain-containing protein [Gemmatimonadales bacterium]
MRRFGVRALSCWTFASAIIVTACHDGSQSPPPKADVPTGSTPGSLDLLYVCGNKFLVTNSVPRPIQVSYRVSGTTESAQLTLLEAPTEDPGFSETELETTETGTVELFHEDVRVTQRINEGVPCGPAALPAVATLAGDEATVGKWSAPFSWPVIGLHLHLLRNGKVLSWGKFGSPQVWDPATKAFSPVPVGSRVFCSGHAFLSDGRLLVNGGHISDLHGIPDANLFNPATMTWSKGPAMAWGRWYPTTTILGNGEAVTIAGTDQQGRNVTVPEVWNGSSWRKLTTAGRAFPYYPRTFLAPNGKIFYAGETRTTYYLSTAGTGSWQTVGDRRYGSRNYGSAVMYRPGKVLYAGGGRTTASAEIIDLNTASPTWRMTGSMAFPRRHLNATILPDGRVLVTGGSSGTGFSDEAQAVHAAELWDPDTGVWTRLASNSVPRVYHATSLLLRDGRVLHTGSGDASGAVDHYDAEIFSPPYLFKGTRPTISSAPTSVTYGGTFSLSTSDPAAITRVTWVRLGSVTHAFDMNQRFNELSFIRVTGGVRVTAPASRNLAPPGHYLMFVLNSKGVPSVARIVRIN